MNINQMGDLSGFMVNPSAAPNATAPAAFNWGAGGQRIPQGRIDRDRQLADALMAADTSPIYSPWQGLARVAQGLTGGWLDHDARKAETANARMDSERMAQLLSGGGSPLEASGGASPAAGGQNWAAIAFNPNAGPQERAYAENMLKQQQAMQMKQMEADIKRQETIIEDNAGNRWRIGANGQPEMVFFDRNAKTIPQMVYDEQGNQYLQHVPIPNAYNELGRPAAQAAPQAPATLPADFGAFDQGDPMQAGEDAAMAGLNNGGILTPAQYQAIKTALGSGAESYLKAHNMRVGR